MPIEDFKFNFKKYCAVQAMHFLLTKYNNVGIDCIKYRTLLNLLYLADKLNIRNYGFPVVGGKYVCTSWGIVAEQILKELKNLEEGQLFFEHIKFSFEHLSITGDLYYGDLCRASEKSLNKVFEDRGTHLGNPEWIHPEDKEYVEFDNSVLLRQCGYSDEDITLVKEEEEYQLYIDKFLSVKERYG